MARQTFRVSGRVINRTTRRAVGGLRVEAWDRDIKLNDPLGSAITDQKGVFEITYDLSAFNDERRRPRPDLFFKVFQGRKLVATTASMPIENAGRRRTVKIEVDVTEKETVARKARAADRTRSAEPTKPLQPVTAEESSPEVTIHELGESVAASLANVQHELDRYQSPLGAFVVDEVDLTIPVRMRVDNLGQVMVIVTDGTNPDGTPDTGLVSQIHLKIKPVLGSHTEPMMAGTQPLSDLTTANSESVESLKQMRIFSVNDYRRVIRTPQGQTALLQRLGWDDKIFQEVKQQMAILTLPVLPVAVSSVLTRRLNFRRVQDFMEADSNWIADSINQELQTGEENRVTAEHVDCWKREARTYMAVKVPCVQPTP